MLISYTNGQTSVILRVKLRQNTGGASPGNGITGLTNASTGLIISTIADTESSATVYTSAGSNVQTIATLGTYAAPSANDCRFQLVDNTNHPGIYEIQIANARFAVSGAKSLLVSITGVSGLADCDVCIPLQSVNPYDAVRGGMTALPNVASGSAGAIITSGTGTAQINTDGAGNGSANLVNIAGSAVSATTAQLGVNAVKINNVATTSVTTINANIGETQPLNFTGTAGSALVQVDCIDWKSGAIPSPNVTGVPKTDPSYLLGTAWLTPGTAGTPDVNAKLIGGSVPSSATIGTVTNLTNLPSIPANWLTATGIASAALNGKGDWLLVSSYTAPPTTAQIATGVWQDATGSDFTAASSIGKSLYTSGVVPGGTNGLFIAGTNAATTITTSLTTHFVGTVDTVTTYTGNTPQTGDSFARIGATGSGLSSLAPASTALSTAQWTNSLATNLGTLAGHDPGATLASTANITAGTITTVSGNVTGSVGSVTGAVGSVTSAVTISLATAVPTTGNAANTIGDCFNAARAQGFGPWTINGTSLTLYAADGVTAVHTFTLNSATAPTQRT
jgi:hypothetical protein